MYLIDFGQNFASKLSFWLSLPKSCQNDLVCIVYQSVSDKKIYGGEKLVAFHNGLKLILEVHSCFQDQR